MEFKVLEKPIYDYVLHEFHAEERLVENINQNLLSDKSMGTDLANTVCQIQTPIVQTPSAQLTDPELQIPPEKLFTHLSFSHFTLIMGVENPLARVFY